MILLIIWLMMMTSVGSCHRKNPPAPPHPSSSRFPAMMAPLTGAAGAAAGAEAAVVASATFSRRATERKLSARRGRAVVNRTHIQWERETRKTDRQAEKSKPVQKKKIIISQWKAHGPFRRICLVAVVAVVAVVVFLKGNCSHAGHFSFQTPSGGFRNSYVTVAINFISFSLFFQ